MRWCLRAGQRRCCEPNLWNEVERLHDDPLDCYRRLLLIGRDATPKSQSPLHQQRRGQWSASFVLHGRMEVCNPSSVVRETLQSHQPAYGRLDIIMLASNTHTRQSLTPLEAVRLTSVINQAASCERGPMWAPWYCTFIRDSMLAHDLSIHQARRLRAACTGNAIAINIMQRASVASHATYPFFSFNPVVHFRRRLTLRCPTWTDIVAGGQPSHSLPSTSSQ